MDKRSSEQVRVTLLARAGLLERFCSAGYRGSTTDVAMDESRPLASNATVATTRIYMVSSPLTRLNDSANAAFSPMECSFVMTRLFFFFISDGEDANLARLSFMLAANAKPAFSAVLFSIEF